MMVVSVFICLLVAEFAGEAGIFYLRCMLRARILQAIAQTRGIIFCSPPRARPRRRQPSNPSKQYPAILVRCSFVNANVNALASAEINMIMVAASISRIMSILLVRTIYFLLANF